MKRITQAALIMIVFALLARTAVISFYPGLGKFTMTFTSSPSDWSEEPVEEDESGEEDKAITEIHGWAADQQESTVPQSPMSSNLPEHYLEIVVPPPQG